MGRGWPDPAGQRQPVGAAGAAVGRQRAGEIAGRRQQLPVDLDQLDRVYKTTKEKYDAAIADSYHILSERLYAQLMAQTHLAPFYDLVTTNWDGGGMQFVAFEARDPVTNLEEARRNPYLSRDDMRAVLARSLALYQDRNGGSLPKRLVIHKTTAFKAEELDGAFDALALRLALAEPLPLAAKPLAKLAPQLGYGGALLLSMLANLSLLPVLLFYFLHDWDQMVARVGTLVPRRWAPEVGRIARELEGGAGYPSDWLEVVVLREAAGDRAAALASLQHAVDAGYRDAAYLRVSPLFRTLAAEPGFARSVDALNRRVAVEHGKVSGALLERLTASP